MFDLNEKVALVTGGAKGIGRGIVEALRNAGAKVLILDIDAEAGRKTAEELGTDFYELDLTKAEEVEKTFKEIHDKYGKIDIVSSNAGIFPQAFIEDFTEEKLESIFKINVMSMFYVVKEAFKYMKPENYGRIIITSSITGAYTGYPGWSHYGATKASQLGFMRSAALEGAKFGITVNSVLPGNILTEGLEAQGEDYLREMEKTIPTHTLGKPTDIGAAVAFFASDEASYITGQSLIVDGGQILPESFDAIL